MKIRSWAPWFLASAVVAAAVAASPLYAQPAPAAAQPEGEVLTDDFLRALGIEREWLQDNAALKSALTEAVTRFKAGDGKATRENLEKAVKADKSLPPHDLLLARLLISINDLTNGRRLLDQVAAKEQNSPEVYLLLGNLALGEGRFTDARLEYTRAGEIVGTVNEYVSSWSEERRDNFLREVYSGKAAAFEQMQEWSAAKNELLPWRQMDPEDPLVFLREGRILYQEGVKPEIDEKTFDSYYDRALAQFKDAYRLQRDQQAKGIRENDPVIERPEIVLLQLHTAANKLDRARAEIKKIDADVQNIRAQDPKEAGRIFTQVSIWYLRQGEFTEAQKYATQATQLDKESPALKALSAMLAYYANDSKAEAEFSQMNQDAPGDFFASNYLALILTNSPDAAKKNRAVQLAEVNARLYPQSAEALSTLGWCYYNIGRYPEALKVMSAFTQGAQISPDTAYYFARILVMVNRFANQDVFSLLQSAVAAKGPFKHRSEAENWLKRLEGDDVAPKPDAPATNKPDPAVTPPGGGATPTPPGGNP